MSRRKPPTKSENELMRICQFIRSGALGEAPIIMNLDDARHFFDIFIQANDRKIPEVVAVNVGDQAFLLFPEWSRQEIVVESPRALVPEDFAFVPNLDWRGATDRPQRFFHFVSQEFLANKLRTTAIFIISFAVLAVVGDSVSTLDLLNTLLIEASTVFLTIYLIFTVSQSERLSNDPKLFDRGILYKYHYDDKNVTKFAILNIALVFANTLFVHAPGIEGSLSAPLQSSVARWLVSSTTALVMTMLFQTFFIVAEYYLERTRDLAERQHIGRILHEEYRKRNPEE